MEHKARRRHVPAFGEWNYYSSSSSPEEPHPGAAAAAAGDAWSYAPEPEACSDAWFRYSPPPRTRQPAPKKARRPRGAVAAAAEHNKLCYDDDEARARGASHVVVARAAPAKGARRVVRPVDADLYGVPPPEDTVCRRPRRKRASRSLWMGYLGGFNCVA